MACQRAVVAIGSNRGVVSWEARALVKSPHLEPVGADRTTQPHDYLLSQQIDDRNTKIGIKKDTIRYSDNVVNTCLLLESPPLGRNDMASLQIFTLYLPEL